MTDEELAVLKGTQQSDFAAVNSNPHIQSSWYGTTVLDPDLEMLKYQSLEGLRFISNRAVKNNFIAATAQQALINFVAGEEFTIKLKGSVASSQLSKHQKFLDRRLKATDANGVRSVHTMVEEIVGAAFGGDVLVKMAARPFDPEHPFLPLTYVEIIDANRIATPADKASDKNIIFGVKTNERGVTISFFIRKLNAEGNASSDFDEIPAFNEQGLRVAVLVKAPIAARPTSTRQYPISTPIFNMIRHVENVLDAKLIRDRVAGSVALVLHSSSPAGTKLNIEGKQERPFDNLGQIPTGSIIHAKAGVDGVSTISPSYGTDGIDIYLLRLLKIIAGYYQIPYEMMWLDLKEVNYSSWRGGAISVQRIKNRWWRVLSPAVEMLVEWVLREGKVTGLNRYGPESFETEIVVPGVKSLDPQKDAAADKSRIIDSKTMTVRTYCDTNGEDFEQLMEEQKIEALYSKEIEIETLKLEKELREKYGLEVQPNDPASGDNAGSDAGSSSSDDGNSSK